MKILVIRFIAIGDVVISTTLCSSLKKSFPDSQVDYMVYGVCGPLFETHPHIDNVIAVSNKQRKNPLRYLQLINSLRKEQYDIIVDASSTGKSELISFFSKKTPIRIGRYKKGRGKNYTHRIHERDHSHDKIEQRLSLLKPLEQSGYNIVYHKNMSVHVDEAQKNNMRETMLSAGINFNRKLFIFSVSSKLSHKKWRLDYQSQIAKHCLEHHNAQIVLYSGSADETKDISDFHQLMGNHKDIFSQINTATLGELAALFSNCDFFFGNEGGPRHIAQALDIPSVAIFSPSANCADWLPGNSDRYRGVEWKDTPLALSENTNYDYVTDDSYYYDLYNSIKPEHVLPILDKTIERHLEK